MDTTYRVGVRYDVDKSGAESAIDSLAAGFDRISSLAKAALSFVGLEQGIKTIMHLGSEAEDTRIALAGMFQAGGAAGTTGPEGFANAMGMASSIMTKMRKDARDLPGEFEDLMNVFRMGIGGGLGAGKSIGEIEALSAKLMAVGATLRMPSDQVGREFAMMMEGRAGAHNVLFMRLRNQLGVGAHEFNALAQPQKWQAIEKAIQGYGPAIREFANTWSAISSTTIDYAKQVARVGTGAMFEALKDSVKGLNEWFERNQQTIEAWARLIGGRVADGINYLVDSFVKSLPFLRSFFGGFIDGFRVVWAISSMVLRFIGGGIEWLNGILGNSADGWQVFVGWVGVAAGVLVGLIAVIKAVEIAQWAWNAAMAANPVGLIAVGVIALAAAIGTLIAYWDDLQDRVTQMFDSHFMRDMMKKAGVVPKNATDADIDDAMSGIKRNRAERNKALAIEQGDTGPMAHWRHMLGMAPLSLSIPGQQQGGPDPFAKFLTEKGKGLAPNNMNVNVRIEQTINDARDPDRIRFVTKQAIEEAVSFPLETHRNRLAVSRY